MTSDYDTIREDNKREYGTGIKRYGPMLLANRYDDRTHFIYELLQNAEDALRRRRDWAGPREVKFQLADSFLRVTHFGQPFDEQDVRGICGIGESTKDLTAIGRFGIGFKSVFAFSDRPEVHSGQEAFAIENFVWPVGTKPIDRHAEETVLLIPLRPTDASAHEQISEGLSRLGHSALLFLRHIGEIRWETSNGHSGTSPQKGRNRCRCPPCHCYRGGGWQSRSGRRMACILASTQLAVLLLSGVDLEKLVAELGDSALPTGHLPMG